MTALPRNSRIGTQTRQTPAATLAPFVTFVSTVALAALAGTGPGMPRAVAQDVAPAITRQPDSLEVYTGQEAAFSVVATGTPEPTYQWIHEARTLGGATQSSLVLTNVTTANAGRYLVRVTNPAGSVTSTNVTLGVLPTPSPTLVLLPVEPGPDPNSVDLPIGYIASGQETSFEFSIAFNPEVLSQPVWLNGCEPAIEPPDDTPPTRTAAPAEGTEPSGPLLEELTGEVDQGFWGLRLVSVADALFPPGPACLGRLRFQLQPGTRFVDGRIGTATNPVPARFTLTNAQTGQLLIQPLPPTIVSVEAPPSLDLQSGLFLQRIQVGFPGRNPLPQARILVHGLQPDALGNPVRVQNAPAFAEDGIVPVLLLNDLQPGETRTLTVEFYVADLQSAPAATYRSDPIAGVSPPQVTRDRLPVRRTEVLRNASYPDGALLVEFPTRTGFSYLVQYAPTLEGLNDSESVRSALPVLTGTGSNLQWIDSGPPKTHAPPDPGGRFYQIIEFR